MKRPLFELKTFEEVCSEIYRYQGHLSLQKGPVETERGHRKKLSWYRSRFSRFLPKSKEARIIDVPCGDGNILYYLKAEGFTNVQGFDLDAGRVSVAQKIGLEAQVEDAYQALKNEHGVDVIFCVDFLEHVKPEAAVGFLELCKSALAEDGIIIFRTPVTDSIFAVKHLYNDLTHLWAVNSNVWTSIAGTLGMQVVRIMDERPVGSGLKNYCRKSAFHAARLGVSLLYRMLNQGPPYIWSPSAWFIFSINHE